MAQNFNGVNARRTFRLPLASRLTVGVAAVAISGCSAIYDPYVKMGEDEPVSPSYAEAVEYAKKKRAEFTKRRDELDRYETSTGALIFGSGLAGLAFAAFGAHTDAILGAGLAGGTAYGAQAFLPTEKRKSIYGNGAKAITCAIKATSIGLGEAPADDNALAPRSLSSTGGISLNTYLTTLTDLSGSSLGSGLVAPRSSTMMPSAAPVMRAAPADQPSLVMRSALFEAQTRLLDRSLSNTRSRVRELVATTNALMVNRGKRLMEATDDVITAIAEQIDKARVDPEAALKAMRDNSLSLVKDAKAESEKISQAVAQTKETVEDTNDALTDTGTEAARLGIASSALTSAVRDAARLTDEKLTEANEIANASTGLQKIIDDQTSCLKTLIDSGKADTDTK
jgi:methyl-accepting chemotaxis protein